MLKVRMTLKADGGEDQTSLDEGPGTITQDFPCAITLRRRSQLRQAMMIKYSKFNSHITRCDTRVKVATANDTGGVELEMKL
jgi:hypothetical protein